MPPYSFPAAPMLHAPKHLAALNNQLHRKALKEYPQWRDLLNATQKAVQDLFDRHKLDDSERDTVYDLSKEMTEMQTLPDAA